MSCNTKKNMNQIFYVHGSIIGWHSNLLCNNVSIYLTKKLVQRNFKGEDKKFLKHLYLNDYAEFDSNFHILCFNKIIFWPVKYLR